MSTVCMDSADTARRFGKEAAGWLLSSLRETRASSSPSHGMEVPAMQECREHRGGSIRGTPICAVLPADTQMCHRAVHLTRQKREVCSCKLSEQQPGACRTRPPGIEAVLSGL